MNLLKDLYFNPSTGFTSAYKLYRAAKKQDSNVKYKDVTDFLTKQYTWQVNKEVKRPARYQTITARFPRDVYQMDIVVYDRYELHKYKYILCCIDVYSRYAYCLPLTNMEAPYLLKKIQEVFKAIGKPRNLNFDQQFSTPKILLQYFDSEGIILYASETDELHKNAIVERFNRTLAGMLQKWRLTQRGPAAWYKVLPQIVQSYNTSFHRTLHATPQDVWNYYDYSRQTIAKFAPTFQIGDKVRAKYEKRTFDKGDAIKYTEDVYTITDTPKPNRYTLQNLRTGVVLKKAHKDYELVRVDHSVDLPPRYQEHVPTVYQGTRARTREALPVRQTRLRSGATQRQDYQQLLESAFERSVTGRKRR